MSPKRNTRPLASTGVSATALALSSAPVTRNGTRCSEVSTMPAGTTAFLPCKRLKYLVGCNTERGELGVGKFDEDFFVLRAVQIDFRDVLDLQQSDLRLHLGGGCSRPHGSDNHDFDGERRILSASQAAIGQQASHTEHSDQEQDQGGMSDRPC